jgi:general nucleoside transport system ATP-binding protein
VSEVAGSVPAVRLQGITKRFDRFVALDAVDLDLRHGEVHALLGENGAGKTTLMNILSGLYRADAGTIQLGGQQVTLQGPREAIGHGIGMVHQHFKLVDTMTVAENLHFGWSATPFLTSPQRLVERAQRLSDEFGIPVNPRARIWQLSVGEQQRVEILRTLSRGARVLILDEPTAVLTDAEAEDLFAVLRRLVGEGRTVVFISHKLREVKFVSDHVTVLRGGKVVGSCDTADVTVHQLGTMMTGEESITVVRDASAPTGAEVVAELIGVRATSNRGLPALRGIDLRVRAGEVLGVAGVSGNGQSELAEVICGLRRIDDGTIVIAGRDVTGAPPAVFSAAGVGHVPEDRIGMALVRTASVRRNAVLRHYHTRALSSRFSLRRGAVHEFADKLVRRARVQVRNPGAPVGQLSGGNQQRLVAHREALVADNLLVAAHPTRGLDVHAAAEVQQALLDRRNAGCGVLLISDDLEEVLRLADRVVVMYDGRIRGEFAAETANRQRIGMLMGGHDEDST